MPKKEWLARFKEHEIRVVNSWLFGGAKLYIDGECRDTNQQQVTVDKTSPLLSAQLESVDGVKHRVEVFLIALFTTKAKIDLPPTSGRLE
jgi:hypothetical protein